ncbi:23S rRNA (adenine(2030)-N(6))-methyltransferase RlmJ [Treponema sp.]|uniref:23S rRNA (adenine(2030)-N(6))-methyltransferase RlmJ n=1 Tax=Treponema sp. TaxID=166 RepID=UPI003F065498
MLSYQHEYHAGNLADVFKHTCLCLILESLCKKEKPFTVIDSHSGAGIFSLEDERLLKTGEAKDGIEKIYSFYKKTSLEFPHGIKEYLELESKFLEKRLYAGSPELERHYIRRGDCLHLVEKHPAAIESLRKNMENAHVIIHNDDSYAALSALTPPLVKRGLVLCDPSYEDADDYKKVCAALKSVRKKWNTAIIALWYPLLLRRKNETAQLLTELEDFCKLGTNPCECIKAELITKNPELTKSESGSHLYGSGMFVMNPPWKLDEELEKNRSFIEKICQSL